MKWGIFFLILVSCTTGPRWQAPSEKEFAVPAELANKFEVTNEKPTAIPVAPVAPAPVKGKKKGNKVVAKPEAPKAKEVTWKNRWGSMKPFLRTGEHYVFDITYFGATAGQMEMELLPPKVVAGRDAYHIEARARTASIFALVYTLNDVAESFLDMEGLFSHKFSLKLDESLQQRDVLELYDQKAGKVYFWTKVDHKKKGKSQEQFEQAIQPYTQDAISAFFYVRTLPFEPGVAYPFPIIMNGRPKMVQVTAIRREVLKTRIGEFPAIVIKPEVVLDGVLKSEGDSFVWLSDDEERRILKIDAKIKVGSVIGYLREHGYGGSPKAKN